MSADYKRMYLCLAAAADAAITAIDEGKTYSAIRLPLFSAIQEAENIYMETDDIAEADE